MQKGRREQVWEDRDLWSRKLQSIDIACTSYERGDGKHINGIGYRSQIECNAQGKARLWLQRSLCGALASLAA